MCVQESNFRQPNEIEAKYIDERKNGNGRKYSVCQLARPQEFMWTRLSARHTEMRNGIVFPKRGCRFQPIFGNIIVQHVGMKVISHRTSLCPTVVPPLKVREMRFGGSKYVTAKFGV